jgi:UDP-N-acetylglucosamine acyltransferase
MSAILSHSNLIAATASIAPTARIGQNVEIGPGAIIHDRVVIGDNCAIGANVIIYPNTVIGVSNRIASGVVIGQEPEDLKYRGEETAVEIGDHNRICEYTIISRGTEGGGSITRIGSHNLLMAYVYVAHDVQIGDRVIIANSCQLAGHVTLEDGVVIGGMSGLHQFTRVGRQAMLGACSYTSTDVPPFVLAEGKPARARGVNIVGLRRSGMPAPDRLEVQRAFKVLYRSGLNRSQALEKLLAGGEPGAQLAHLIRFVQSAERGLIRGTKEAAE